MKTKLIKIITLLTIINCVKVSTAQANHYQWSETQPLPTPLQEIYPAIFNQEINPQLQKIKFLSPSERTIVRLVANGRTTKEISASLSISRRTVEKHRANIIAKLDLPKRVDALSVWSLENKELILSL